MLARGIVCRIADVPLRDFLSLNSSPFLCEYKYDGERAIAIIADKVIIANKRNSIYYPLPKEFEVALRMATHGRVCLLDGELISGDGKNFYQFLSDRAKLSNALNFIVFDIIELDGCDYRDTYLSERRKFLEDFIEENERVKLSKAFLAVNEDEIFQAYNNALNEGYEGIVVKPFKSFYRDGAWLKLKRKKTLDALVLAIRKTDAWLENKIPVSFLIGFKENGNVKPFGHVGSGLSLQDKNLISQMVDALKVKEDDEYVWLKPALIFEVEYEEILENSLRSPRIVKLRNDKTPDEIDYIRV